MPIWEQRNRLGEGKNRMVLPHKNHSTTFSSFFLLLTVSSRTAPAEGLFHYLLYDTTCTAPECSCPFLNSAHAGFPGEGGHRAGAHSPPFIPLHLGSAARDGRISRTRGFIWPNAGAYHMSTSLYRMSCWREPEALLAHNSYGS